MPEALSDDAGPYQHNWALLAPYNNIMTGWAMPPNDIGMGRPDRSLGAPPRRALRRATRSRPGPGKCWNEPDGHYWKGTIPEFCAMYDATVAAVQPRPARGPRRRPAHLRRLQQREGADIPARLPPARESTPASPLDFVGFHAKGQPQVSRRPRAHGARTSSSSTSTPTSRSSTNSPSSRASAGGDRRVRSRGLRRLLGPRPSAERLPQRAALRRLSRRDILRTYELSRSAPASRSRAR